MNYIPKKPFDDYKWFFATKAPTESLGDPAVLLGLINRVSPIADGRTSYSSDKFAKIMHEMQQDIDTTVDLGRRIGERNIMRNSAQYWKIFGLIPNNVRGVIQLTPFAESIVSGKISQVDFASAIIVSFVLPNHAVYTNSYHKWKENELLIHPFKLILKVMRCLYRKNLTSGWLTNQELYSIIVPMAGDKQSADKMAEFILNFREGPDVIKGWYNAVPKANDKRYTGEYLRFLANFCFVAKDIESDSDKNFSRDTGRFSYISQIDDKISELIDGAWSENSEDIISMVRNLDINSSVILSSFNRSSARPNQQKFRRELLETTPRCPITDYDLPMVLQAAHIRPHSHGGDDTISNGFLLRSDIHLLFDSGVISLKPNPLKKGLCDIELSNDEKVISNYRGLRQSVQLPEYINMENVRWRYENRLLGVLN